MFADFINNHTFVDARKPMDESHDSFAPENLTDEERADVHAAIIQGIADIKAGRGRPAEEVMGELLRKHGISIE